MTHWNRRASIWKLRLTLARAWALIWIARTGRAAELTPETHLFLAHLYDQLSHAYRVRARHAKAKHFARLAAEHYRAGGWDGPPFTPALAMPRPARWVRTDAVSRHLVTLPRHVA